MENTGNVPLSGVNLRDQMDGLTLNSIDAPYDEGAAQPENEAAVSLPQLSSKATLPLYSPPPRQTST